MIAADAPILFCKACEIFIAEITARAFIIADSNKRRTLSRADIAKALSKSDQFDFLIDIVPREEPLTGANQANRPQKKASATQAKLEQSGEERHSGSAENVHPGGNVTSSVDLEQLQTLLNPPGTENRAMP